MGDAALGQCRKVVAAFQHRHQPAARVTLRNRDELLGDPLEIRGLQLPVGEWIAAVAVKSRGNQQQLRTKRCQRRQQVEGLER